MLDINNLVNPSSFFRTFYEKEIFLFNELAIYNSSHEDQKPININNTLLEIENIFQTRSFFENELVRRKQIAPVWKTALSMWIYEIEHYMLGNDFDDDNYVNMDYNHNLINDVYLKTTAGIKKYLHEYAGELIFVSKSGDNNKGVLIEKYLKEISTGVSIAFVLPNLKLDLGRLTDQPDLTETDLKNLDPKNNKDKLSSKQQVLLLNKLGVFELPILNKLNEIQKGKLFGYLLNRDEGNIEDYIRYRNYKEKDTPIKKLIKTDLNTGKISELLKELGIDKD